MRCPLTCRTSSLSLPLRLHGAEVCLAAAYGLVRCQLPCPYYAFGSDSEQKAQGDQSPHLIYRDMRLVPAPLRFSDESVASGTPYTDMVQGLHSI